MTRLAVDLIYTIQIVNIFSGIKFPQFCELGVYESFWLEVIFEKSKKKLAKLRYQTIKVLRLLRFLFLCIASSFRKLLIHYEHANKFNIITTAV